MTAPLRVAPEAELVTPCTLTSYLNTRDVFDDVECDGLLKPLVHKLTENVVQALLKEPEITFTSNADAPAGTLVMAGLRCYTVEITATLTDMIGQFIAARCDADGLVRHDADEGAEDVLTLAASLEAAAAKLRSVVAPDRAP